MPESLISPKARIGKNVQIGYATRIYDDVEIGDGTVIGDHCSIGLPVAGSSSPAIIGPESTVRSHAVIYQDAQVGPQFQCGHHMLMRDGLRAGVNLRVGSFSALEGQCVIGDYCRFHGHSHVTRGASIGNFVWIFSYTMLSADPLPPSHFESGPTLEDGVVVSVSCTLLPGTILRRGAFVCADSCARGDVPPGGVVDGHRGEVICHVTQLSNRKLGIAHPWMSHFADAYPEEARERIEMLRRDILGDIPAYEAARARRGAKARE